MPVWKPLYSLSQVSFSLCSLAGGWGWGLPGGDGELAMGGEAKCHQFSVRSRCSFDLFCMNGPINFKCTFHPSIVVLLTITTTRRRTTIAIQSVTILTAVNSLYSCIMWLNMCSRQSRCSFGTSVCWNVYYSHMHWSLYSLFPQNYCRPPWPQGASHGRKASRSGASHAGRILPQPHSRPASSIR